MDKFAFRFVCCFCFALCFLFCLVALVTFPAKLRLYFTGCFDSTDPVLSQISENPLTTSFQAAADPQWTYQYPSCDGGGQETQNNFLNDWRISTASWSLLGFRRRTVYLSTVLVPTCLYFGPYPQMATYLRSQDFTRGKRRESLGTRLLLRFSYRADNYKLLFLFQQYKTLNQKFVCKG